MRLKKFILDQIEQTKKEILITANEVFGTNDIEDIRKQTASILSDANGDAGLLVSNNTIYEKDGFYLRHGKEGTHSRSEANIKLSCGLALLGLAPAIESINKGDINKAQKLLNDSIGLHGSCLTNIGILKESKKMAKNKASKKRPKKESTNKLLTMGVMTSSKNKGDDLRSFIQSSLVGSVDSDFLLEMTTGCIDDLKSNKAAIRTEYEISWCNTTIENVKYRTLADWWTDCDKT